ncbi:Holliday junction resolvase RecU [Leptotrichia sp. oral taxon 223]|uniref:Holliday junction resolvase RecU n=1 Tax=Leptotrichia sp. oral taxon 223 TaxID=712363 RepID=UPI0015B8EA27|nr:Holliday junction resolvase RecU [Leptotrichia sp. oral taxon 223]NWO18190.1 Holliday junction resolvase RecU [Leptotrichia sp. oral taxon 223]
MAMNAGKKFENDFKNSIDTNEIFLHRFKDGTTGTVNGQMVRFKNKNLCDFLLFKDGLLVLVELKSFLGKSMPFSNIKDTVDEQQTFLYNLRLEAKKNNVKAYMILNFRDLSETYAIDIHNFDEFYKMTNKKSINIDEVRQLGKQLSQQKKRTSYRYEIDGLFS